MATMFDFATLATSDLPLMSLRESRQDVSLHGAFGGAGRSPILARIRNLSAGGLMADLPYPVDPGDRIHVLLRGVGDVNGRVAWTGEGRIGMTFDRAIDPQAVFCRDIAPRPTACSGRARMRPWRRAVTHG